MSVNYDDRHGAAFHDDLPAELARFFHRDGAYHAIKPDGSEMSQTEFDAMVDAFDPLDHQPDLSDPRFQMMIAASGMEDDIDTVLAATKAGGSPLYGVLRYHLAQQTKKLSKTLELVATMRGSGIPGLTLPTDDEIKAAWTSAVAFDPDA